MSSLIIAVLAAALSILALLSSLILLGEASTDNGAKAQSAKLRNQAQQIAGAITIYQGDGNFVGQDFKLEDLTDRYLVGVPSPDWKAEASHIYRTDISFESCALSNEQMNMRWAKSDSDVYINPAYPDKVIPYCSKADISPMTPCCYTPDDEASP